MASALKILSPKPLPTEDFTDASAAVARLEEIYERNTGFLRGLFEAYAKGEPLAARGSRRTPTRGSTLGCPTALSPDPVCRRQQ